MKLTTTTQSGTVLDLPYKFGSEDQACAVEDNFNTEIVPVAERPKKRDPQEIKQARKRREKVKREKAKMAQHVEKGELPLTDTCGPKLTENGCPVLPTRKVPRNDDTDEPEQSDETMLLSKTSEKKKKGIFKKLFRK